jgi:dimethylargininase
MENLSRQPPPSPSRREPLRLYGSQSVPIAITRGISPRIHECELTHVEREPIDLDRAGAQHRQYEECLADLGYELLSMPAEPDLPDSVFVEDTALVLDELAVIMRPGAASRRPETASIAKVLTRFRDLFYIEEPGTIDGGDVLRIGKNIFVGLSYRSNAAGVEQLGDIVKPYGYRVEGVCVAGCLHLKSAVTQVADDTLLINRKYVDPEQFPKMRLIDVDPSEPHGANALWVRDSIIYPAACCMTTQKLRDAGLKVRSVDVSELAKAEAGVTCCSLVFDVDGRR